MGPAPLRDGAILQGLRRISKGTQAGGAVQCSQKA